MKACPHCGASIHEAASFCPYCASSINRRTELSPPRRIPKRVLYSLLLIVLVAVLAGSAWLYSRPKTYDGVGELLYTDRDGTYQIVVSWMNSQFQGAREVHQPVEEGDTLYTFPLCLFINYPSSGVNAKGEFMAKVERVTTQFIQPEDSGYPWETDEPAPRLDRISEAALVSSIHFKSDSGTAELVWTIEMKNGDTIRLRQRLIAEPYPVYRYYPEDTPMGTIEELQTLVDELSATETDNQFSFYELHLPPTIYEGGLVMNGQSIRLYGSTDEAGNRTAFTGTVQVLTQGDDSCYIEDVDFIGEGSSIGVSASARLFLIGCHISGWRTGVLSYGYSWVCLWECTVEENEIGFHFNATGGHVMDTRYLDNQFRNNGTAVLLESVPSDVVLEFSGTRFTGNGTDIDNRCGQELEIAGAFFE